MDQRLHVIRELFVEFAFFVCGHWDVDRFLGNDLDCLFDGFSVFAFCYLDLGFDHLGRFLE